MVAPFERWYLVFTVQQCRWLLVVSKVRAVSELWLGADTNGRKRKEIVLMSVLDTVRSSGIIEKAEQEVSVEEVPVKTMVNPVDQKTVKEAREDLMQKVEDGEQVTCPVCDQNCKMYKRKLNVMQAVFICWLVRRWIENGGEWINVPKEYPKNIGGEYGKLVHWKLAELKPNDEDPSKKTSGLWRPTQKGIDFVAERITVPKHIFLYNNELHSVSEEQTTIRESLGEKFDYEELMDE